MTWIRVIEPGDADGRLASIYEKVETKDGHVDNILKAHSLRPRTLEAHLALYKATLHSESSLSPRERELLGVVVSTSNDCEYCVAHHLAALTRHTGSAEVSRDLANAAVYGLGSEALTARERAMAEYAARLTRTPAAVSENDLDRLREAGLDDVAILDVNQIAAYFAYANRTVLGLGVETAGEPLGLHPTDDGEGWRHE